MCSHKGSALITYYGYFLTRFRMDIEFLVVKATAVFFPGIFINWTLKLLSVLNCDYYRLTNN